MSGLRVFINYRREDSSGHAGRLYDALAEYLGADQVFMDIDTIEPGVNFAQVVDESVGSCDVLIALIGPHWASATDRQGNRRLDKPEDWVRMEIARALERGETKVIPALVQGAEMPSAEDLPEPLRELALTHAIELSDARWRYDVGRLTQLLGRLEEKKLGGERPVRPAVTATRRPEPPAPPQRNRGRTALIVAGVLALVVAGAAFALVGSSGSDDDDADPPARTDQPAVAEEPEGAEQLSDQGCENESSLKSSAGTAQTTIDFVNERPDAVRVLWLDADGQRQDFGSVEAGTRRRLNTYASHPWVVEDASGACLGIYVPSTDPATVAVPGAGP